MWNPLTALKKKLIGAAAPQTQAKAIDATTAEAALGGAAGLKELEQKGLLSKFFRHWKDPKLLKQLRAITARMQAEGVNLKDKNAVQAWLKSHEQEVESGQFTEAPADAKPQTYVKTGPDVGRNDPCPCGSGKKYKKCCAAKAG